MICGATELATMEYNVAFAKVHEERQNVVEARKATTSRREATLAIVYEGDVSWDEQAAFQV